MVATFHDLIDPSETATENIGAEVRSWLLENTETVKHVLHWIPYMNATDFIDSVLSHGITELIKWADMEKRLAIEDD